MKILLQNHVSVLASAVCTSVFQRASVVVESSRWVSSGKGLTIQYLVVPICPRGTAHLLVPETTYFTRQNTWGKVASDGFGP